jgi:hypothetical protein
MSYTTLPFAWCVTLWWRDNTERNGAFETYVTKVDPFRVRQQVACLRCEAAIVSYAPITEAEMELAIETGIEEWT